MRAFLLIASFLCLQSTGFAAKHFPEILEGHWKAKQVIFFGGKMLPLNREGYDRSTLTCRKHGERWVITYHWLIPKYNYDTFITTTIYPNGTWKSRFLSEPFSHYRSGQWTPSKGLIILQAAPYPDYLYHAYNYQIRRGKLFWVYNHYNVGNDVPVGSDFTLLTRD